MIVEFEAVDKRYEGVQALDRVDLQISEGSITGLIGPNGAGKTTSLLLMSTLLERDGGRVRVAGFDPQQDPRAVRKVVGYMPDFFGFYESLTVSEYLEFFAAANRVGAGRRQAIIADLLALVDLEDRAATDVNTLSRGMKQRLSLARAMVHEPELLVLDEPASGLDPRARVYLRELIAELARLGKTIVISSHILAELEGICSHMAIIDRGRVKAQGTMEEIGQALVAGRRVTARVLPETMEQAERLLSSDPAVAGSEIERGRLRFRLSGGDDESARVLGMLVAGGVAVSEWKIESAGLEEIFLQITEEAP